MKTLIFLISILLVGCTNDEKIYVSKDGGKNTYKTITDALKHASEGDEIYVKSGIYRESIAITKSGITITSDNKNVFITATDLVEGFVQDRPGVYKVYMPEKVTQLFVDDVPQVRAKFPNQEVNPDLFEFSTIKINISGDTLISDEITQPDSFFDGATVWMIVGHRWVGGTAKVKEHKGNMLLLSNISLQYRGEGIAFISDVKNCLDNNGEWYWENDTLYFNSNIDIAKSKIEAKTRETLIAFDNVSNVKISGLNGYAGNVIFDNSQNCKLSNGSFKYLSDYNFIDAKTAYSRGKMASLSMYGLGISMFGTNDTLENCEVSWSAGDCISLYGENNKLIDCTIHDANYRGTDCAPVAIGGTGNCIFRCEIFNAGRDVIYAPSAKQFKIMHNRVYESGKIAWDLGLIYTYGTDGEDSEIAYNHFFSSKSNNPEDYWGGSGIYLDNGSQNFLVHHNVSFDAKGLGIQINDPGINLRIYNNTVYKTTYDMIPYNNGHIKLEPKDCKFYNNYIDRPIKKTKWIEEKNNIYTKEDYLQNRDSGNYLPKKNSPLIDKGVIIEELKDIPFVGDAPDIGAYEYGQKPWTVGPHSK